MWKVLAYDAEFFQWHVIGKYHREADARSHYGETRMSREWMWVALTLVRGISVEVIDSNAPKWDHLHLVASFEVPARCH